jgi:ATP-dependent Clp protease ATP-binding subunit ClpA
MLNDDLSARHFTTSAISIIGQMWSRAADRSEECYMNEEAMTLLALWSLLRWERKVGLVALEELGVDTDGLAKEVNKALRTTCDEVRRSRGQPRTRRLPCGGHVVETLPDEYWNTPLAVLLAAAEHEALAVGHNYVGSEHVLLGIIQQASPRLRQILEAQAITHDRAKTKIHDLLSGSCHGPGLCGGGPQENT